MTLHTITTHEAHCDGRLATACDAAHPDRPHTCPVRLAVPEQHDLAEALRAAHWGTVTLDGHQRHFCPSHKAQGRPLSPCPECVAGKHQNCNGETWDETADRIGTCPCATQGHP